MYEGAQAVNSTLELAQVLDRLRAARPKRWACGLLDSPARRNRRAAHVAAAYGLSDAYVRKGDLILEHNPLAREVLAGEGHRRERCDTRRRRLQYPHEACGRRYPLDALRAACTARSAARVDSRLQHRAQSFYARRRIPHGNCQPGQHRDRKRDWRTRRSASSTRSSSKFVLTVTHELRSPVSVVRSLLRTMTAGYAGAL